jgi:predicted AAA+ superfamily ATPase
LSDIIHISVYHARFLERLLLGSVSRNKIRVLFGARQTGKTMLLRHALPAEATRFFNLQESDLRRRFEADPAAFRREVLALPRTVRNVVVDEIQKVPALLEEVQSLYDAAPRARHLFLTGSSARQLRARSANLLPGRSHAWRIHPICRWEMAITKPPEIPPRARPGAGRRGPAPPFSDAPLGRMLRLGCLPGVLGETPGTAAATLATYVGTYLEEEVRREALVRDLGPFIVFLRLAGAESGRQVNLGKLSQESGVPASTLRTYYQVLVDTFIGHWLEPYGRRTRKRLLTTPRFYLFDLGVRNAAAELSLDTRVTAEDGGALLEHWVGQELLGRAGYLGPPWRLSFWRTATGAEVDFVWEGPREDVPIEVKWTERPRPGDARHLEKFLDEYPTRARRGLLVCRCPEPQQLTDRVRAIGWDRL